ncbi:MAG: thymidine kinase [Ignavibacteria bacterium]|jgi:thymidine kinase|nr:thymidine kinase [Ignavibacteria bacterium]MBK6772419.1 thymidine kinase [Ignavibacteria bacterium]MBK7158611.1 thymidine kinase [Ignavibacteria bacterium]MBK7254606.1 thymidine kinase [Ignavibacteria bacterium]MBK7447032.1 thymidine kinase [Ignavibacteria bacterium]
MNENLQIRTFKKTGHIEVICGSMFSGKTEELIRRIRRAEIAKQRVKVFKPKIDNRYSEFEIVSHNEQSYPSEVVNDADEILEKSFDVEVIGIDEAQFFENNLVGICQQMADSGKRVIVAGLDQDYKSLPFEPMPQLLAVAEYISKTLAVCVVCGAPANRTQRITDSGEKILVGAKNHYEARCRLHHVINSESEKQ